MTEENRLLALMVGHHALIETLFSVFKSDISKSNESKLDFDDFKWQLEKHFFVEEKINFKFVFSGKPELSVLINRIKEEHGQLLGMLNRIEADVLAGKIPETAGFEDLLKKHRETEEKILYPELNKALSVAQKEIVIARINDVALKK